MTAVIGMLNKKGVAIAADSACTVTIGNGEKIVNTANKMLRLSSLQPISVMIVGSATFLRTPWDIIIRRFRQQRGNVSYDTVEDCIQDFFNFIPTEETFFPRGVQEGFLKYSFVKFLDLLERRVPSASYDQDDKLKNTKQILRAFRQQMKAMSKRHTEDDICPMFKDYGLHQFHKVSDGITNEVLKKRADNAAFCRYYPIEIYQALKTELEVSFLEEISSRNEHFTLLVFSGYGEKEEYPTLISAVVNEGFDHRVCYHIKPEDIVHISDERPVAICPYAQTDVIQTLVNGLDPYYFNDMMENIGEIYDNCINNLINSLQLDDDQAEGLIEIINEVKKDDLIRQLPSFVNKQRQANERRWLKMLVDYDLQDMANFAENMIAMTSFERRITFGFEGVGGPVDLAIITKKDGFTWLKRKSWYYHKDVGGRYGKFGV